MNSRVAKYIISAAIVTFFFILAAGSFNSSDSVESEKNKEVKQKEYWICFQDTDTTLWRIKTDGSNRSKILPPNASTLVGVDSENAYLSNWGGTSVDKVNNHY